VATTMKVHHMSSSAEVAAFLEAIKLEFCKRHARPVRIPIRRG